MSAYEILNINNINIIIANSYINPFDQVYEIERELEQKKYKGKVIFDFLLCNGLSSNRYMEIYFNGSTFDLKTYKNMACVDDVIKKAIFSYYFQHLDNLEQSNLPNAQRFLIRKGIEI
ncbi:MAG: hypothetical protein HDR22_06755 [Lachnospiraceae bacterium]|nr:hypothetical protein [Lachnospiraceae bacterium]